MRKIRIFVSSPGGVEAERRRVDRVMERLNGEFSGTARLEAARRETRFYTADRTFQEHVPAYVDCDLGIGLSWSRLGGELPPGFAADDDGKPWPSGTAYEILTAIRKRQTGVELLNV